MTRAREIAGRVVRRAGRIGWRVTKIVADLSLLGAIALAIAVYGVDYPAGDLSPDHGGPLIITDKDGNVLRSVPAPDGRPGRAAWVGLGRITPAAVLTVLASEDDSFFEHGGVDASGLLRAGWLDLKKGRMAYGGSTITMQLVKMLRGDARPSGVFAKLGTKLKEVVLAMRLERALDKQQILEQYLNRAFYGNGAYGIEAAARTYFDKSADSLSVAEATLLAVIPRAPTRYEPLHHLAEALRRRDHVFALLAERGLISPDEVARARAEKLTPTLHRPAFRAPHFVDWVIAGLPDDVRERGGVVRTTLDLALQEQLEHRLTEHVATLASKGLDQAGIVVLDTATGQVRAMVGSPGFFDNAGQVNIATEPRHPGSALKPFVYALAIEQGDSPASIALDVADVKSEYHVDRLTQHEHGPVRYREALASSYNLAAVHTLEKVGVPRLVSKLRQAGLGVGEAPSEYGLRLALGAATVRLVDLAAAYGFLVRGGKVTHPAAVLGVTSTDGSVWQPARAPDQQLYTPQASWLTMDMLSDAAARRPMFGQELPLDLEFAVAAKTGTSRGFADTVTVAVTREFTVAAWGGNFDGRPTQGLVAMQAAAPLARAALGILAAGHSLTLPSEPDGIVEAEVCPLSGLAPGPACHHRKVEHFVAGTAPTKTCDWHIAEPDGSVSLHYPPALQAWATRKRDR